jgi:hypothetical protein
MKHFYNKIHGWFTFPQLYTDMVSRFPSGSHFVEIGVWKGKSAAFMAVEIINSKKQIRFDCVDTWKGSEEHLDPHGEAFEPELLKNKDWIWDCFNKNIEAVKKVVHPIRKPSLEAVQLYADNSLDFVFIDAAHDYENVTKDVEAWFPKVITNKGIIAGHDYSWGPEVKRAVDDFFTPKGLAVKEQEGCWVVAI